MQTSSEYSGRNVQGPAWTPYRCNTAGLDVATLGAGAPFWKRFLDVTLILLFAPIWAPLMLLLAVGIKCVSPGPALFRQERIGYMGRPFVCLKFRTMRIGASTAAHEKYLTELIHSNRPMAKLDGHDPRLIPFARVLRSTGLDELPQLLNVLRGDMSLVGPRPCTPPEYEAYTRSQRARTGTLPGLTGLWQVNGKNRTTFNEMIELDIRYLKTLGLWLDLGIMLRTPLALLQQVLDTLFTRRIPASPSLSVIARPAPIQIRMATTRWIPRAGSPLASRLVARHSRTAHGRRGHWISPRMRD